MTIETAHDKKDSGFLWSASLPHAVNYAVLVLSFGLIVFISYDTYRGVNYLENNIYMTYQLICCIIFLLDYFYRLFLSKHKFRFFILALPFLLISIPYLNIVVALNINVPREALLYLCFIPILRGLLALIMVVSFIAKKITTTVFASYILVMIPFTYMCGLIFYIAEKDINIAVKNFWYALWWAGMNITTIGCYINPRTAPGMIISFLLSLMGIVMLPLFTVYCGDMISTLNKKLKNSKD